MAEEAQDGEQEPTMEEILASIRKIISDGDVEEDSVEDAVEAEPVDDSTEDELDDVLGDFTPEPSAFEETPDAVDEIEEDVLELTDMVNDDGSVTDISELSDDVDDTSTDALEEAAPAMDEFEIADTNETAPEPEPEAVSSAEPAEPVNLELISNQPAVETTGSFASLAGAVAASHGVPIGAGNKTLEDIVKELLRPMLKEWLDDNLPPLVERLVEREINKLAGQVEKK